MTKQHYLNTPVLEEDDNGNLALVYTIAHGLLAGRRVVMPATLEPRELDIATLLLDDYLSLKYTAAEVDGFIEYLKYWNVSPQQFVDAEGNLDRDLVSKEYARWIRWKTT